MNEDMLYSFHGASDPTRGDVGGKAHWPFVIAAWHSLRGAAAERGLYDDEISIGLVEHEREEDSEFRPMNASTRSGMEVSLS